MRYIVVSKKTSKKRYFDKIDNARAYALTIAHKEHGADIYSEKGVMIGVIVANSGRNSDRNIWMDFTSGIAYELNKDGELIKRL